MEKIVTHFVSSLRQAGVRVSPSEILDAVTALSLGGMTERKSVQAILRLTLVKQVADLPIFERVFDQFFSSSGENDAETDFSELVTSALISLEGPGLKKEIFEKGEDSGLKLVVEDEDFNPDNFDTDIDDLEQIELDDSGAPKFVVQVKGDRHKSREAKPLPSDVTHGYLFKPDKKWQNDGFNPFSDEEQAAMLEVVARMIQRLRKDVRRLKDKQSSGRIHVIKTIQKNYRHGMIPFLLALRRKRKQKPRLVVLCDVSYSVSHASRFMLFLLHTLQNRLMDVRSFVYNKDLAEVTDIIRDMPVNSLLNSIEGGGVVDLDEATDFGRVLLAFRKKYLESLRGKPAVIILGDARNNYNKANEWVLEEIREQVGYMLWLTPEESSNWNLGDCQIRAYGRYCNKVEVVTNVDELSLVVEALVRDVYAKSINDFLLNQPVEEPIKTGSATKAWRQRLGLRVDGFS